MKEIIVIVTCLCGMPKKDTRTLAELERDITRKDSIINSYFKKSRYNSLITLSKIQDSVINEYKKQQIKRTVEYKQGLIYLELSK
jgi:hypothetical protein